jgi:hypothetical protein
MASPSAFPNHVHLRNTAAAAAATASQPASQLQSNACVGAMGSAAGAVAGSDVLTAQEGGGNAGVGGTGADINKGATAVGGTHTQQLLTAAAPPTTVGDWAHAPSNNWL